MTQIAFTGTMPILRIFSIEKAHAFYVDFLGFSVDWEHRFEASFPLYMQVSRAGLELHLSEHHGDATPGSTVFVTVQGIAAFRNELIAKPYLFTRPDIESMPWGSVLEVIDPFGNRLRFCERHADAAG